MRGDLVTVALQGDHGKPRPALVVQSDRFEGTATVAVLLVTSTLIEAPLARITCEPTPGNGLRARSQVMVDKPMAVPARKVGPAFGRLEAAVLREVDAAMALFLGLGG